MGLGLTSSTYWQLQRVVAVEEAVFDHVEHERGGADLQIGRDFRHVGVADDDMEAPVSLGVGVRLVTGIDDGA